ncbi:MAG TPA: hypothetical protein ENK77_01145 [Epsilonproteobacteria bacterium]|nr:hypothetical protein [Campylobacterota bacterium]
MKRIISRLKNIELEEHLDEMQLALFLDKKLNEAERGKVFQHLSQCKQCRDVLRMGNEMRERKQLKPVNNASYVKALLPLIAGVVLFFGVPIVDKPPAQNTFKSMGAKKNIFDTSIEYWEKLWHRYFGERQGK